MLKQLEELKSNALQDLEGISNIKQLESWRIRYLGKKSELTKVLRSLATLPLVERKAVGTCANEVKAFLESNLLRKAVAIDTF